MKIIVLIISMIFGVFLTAGQTEAHVTVKPAEVGIGARQNFSVSVPTEKDIPTVEVRLIIPEGLKSVRPNVKPGWEIELKKSGIGEEAIVKEIVWSGGSIPAEQRDEFIFSAQAPTKKILIAWKAYQTYSDGEVVAWDTDPKIVKESESKKPKDEEASSSLPKPYSETKVIDDLKSSVNEGHDKEGGLKDKLEDKLPLVLSVLAVAMSGLALRAQNNTKKKK